MLSVLWLKLKRMALEAPLYVIMMLMAILLSFIFGNAVFNNNEQRVYVVNYDDSEFTQSFINNLDENTYAFVFVEEEEAKRNIQKGSGIAAMIIPNDFSENRGDAQITLLQTTNSVEVMGFKNAINAAYSKTLHLHFLQGYIEEELGGDRAINIEDVELLYNENMGEGALIKVISTMFGVDEYDYNYEANIHYLMGFNIFFVMFSIIFTIGSILEDKHLKIWDRMKISPLKNAQILAGNFIPTYVVGIIQMGIVLFAGQYLFSMNLGNSVFLIYLIFMIYTLTATCLGLFLCSILKNYEQLDSLVPIVAVSTGMIGGCMWPLSIINSRFMLALSTITPQRWAMQATQDIAIYNAGFGDILKNIIVLLIMATIFFTASLLIMKKKY